jgi:hypothetical protein
MKKYPKPNTTRKSNKYGGTFTNGELKEELITYLSNLFIGYVRTTVEEFEKDVKNTYDLNEMIKLFKRIEQDTQHNNTDNINSQKHLATRVVKALIYIKKYPNEPIGNIVINNPEINGGKKKKTRKLTKKNQKN